MIAQVHRFDHLIGGLPVDAAEFGEVADVVDHPQVVVNGRVLRHVSNPMA
ncbi:Uncharacterised protein [Mycobacterium tuberculosis]|uniref:Uncharacterized protein n=1 Tax=Mycobacterium tuberculosis TaxID=1773 RepID=A0A916LBN9_MYCTX|nr:Uncharacterised protein [Mycobacterium tuberculosis]